MNRLPTEKRVQIIKMLVEGNSIRGTARIADVSKNTVMKLLVETGEACAWYQDQVLRDLKSTRIELDEIWSFCHTREKNLTPEKKGEEGYGDIWTFTAIDPDTKLVPCWRVGSRTAATARLFVNDLFSRLSNKVQITTDGYRPYLEAVERTFGGEVDYAVVVKVYGETEAQSGKGITDIITQNVTGKPDTKKISTSSVERNNLTMRTNIKRFARKTNAHSKKVENHGHAIALHMLFYHFCRIHSSLRVTPAMAAGVSDRLWSVEDIVDMVDGF
jgi:IS1 family transposase